MDGCKFNMNADRRPTDVSSITAEKINKIAKQSAANLITYHKFHFTRVYPSAAKFDSSNYNPIEAWVFGAQLVALNFQTPDMGMLLNWGWYQLNGGAYCGYVLKPSFMTELS
jgi:phosphatidylinositol phospholipase C eta